MRIAVISDIHGNLTALNAVMDDITQAGVDDIICLGDVTAVGPQPQDTLHRIRDMNCPVLMGNHDTWLLTQNDMLLIPESDQVDGMLYRRIRDIDSWCRSQLTEDDLDYISGFDHTYEMSINGETLLFYHASPRVNTDMLLSTTPPDIVELMIAGHPQRIMIGGHTHLQMIRRHREKLLINVGSIGSPFYYNNQGEIRNPWWAEYGIITVKPNHLSIDLRQVPYDVDRVLDIIEESGMPHADWWIAARD